MRLSRWLAAASLGIGVPAAWAADGDAADWLLQMTDAARSVNYQGVVVYRGDDILETFRVVHRYGDGDERERVQSLTGQVREVLKDDNQVICILPKNQRVTTDRPTPKGLFPSLDRKRLEQISEVYSMRDLGAARVAGRNCRGIQIRPRDEYRYGYEVWADEVTAVPLKVSLLGEAGRILEQMFFTDVEFPETIPDAAFQTAFDPETMRRVTIKSAGAISESAAEDVGPVAGAPERHLDDASLPPGFHVAMRETRTLPGGRGQMEHVLLSDGLSTISVFRSQQVVADNGDGGFEGVSQMGPLNAYGRVIGRMRVTVVGDVPPATVRMIGDSFKMTPDHGLASSLMPGLDGKAPAPVARHESVKQTP